MLAKRRSKCQPARGAFQENWKVTVRRENAHLVAYRRCDGVRRFQPPRATWSLPSTGPTCDSAASGARPNGDILGVGDGGTPRARRRDIGPGRRLAGRDVRCRPPVALVLHGHFSLSEREPIPGQYMRIVDPVSVHEYTMFRAEIAHHQGAVDLVQYTVEAADLRVGKENVRFTISPQNCRQASHDAVCFHATIIEDGQLNFEESRRERLLSQRDGFIDTFR